MRRIFAVILWLGAILAVFPGWAAADNAPAPMPMEMPMAMPTTSAAATTQPRIACQVSIDVVSEEGQKLIRATVLAKSKPVENVTLIFGVKRTFGTLVLGEDKTLDDGTAAVKYPADIPGGLDGKLEVVAEIKAPADYVPARAQATLEGARKLVVDPNPFPRALWGRRAPFELLVPIALLLGGVWSAYAFVFAQILAIRRGAK